MSWLGSTETPAGRAVLSKEQWKMLTELAENNEYWKASLNFMRGINNHELASLSEKQLDWYGTIEAGLDVEIDRKIAREVFGDEQIPKAAKKFWQGSMFPNE